MSTLRIADEPRTATADKTSAKGTVVIGLLADFNVQNLASLLQKAVDGPHVTCTLGPFAQTMTVLLDPAATFWSEQIDALVLWTLPDRVSAAFRKALSCEDYSLVDLLDDVDSFADIARNTPESVQSIFIPSWIMPAAERGWGSRDLTAGVGVANALMRMNLRLADRLSDDPRVVLLESSRWAINAGAVSYNPTLWYLSKTPFHTAVFQEASQDILSALDGIRGFSKKIVVLDLDNTLWGGVVGEVGWEKLRLGGHDPVGEAFVDFQRSLKRLMNRGIILAIVSKNEEALALQTIRQHPEMILRVDDFVAWRINWRDKAENIVDLLSDLNLGLDSAVFIDDSAFERARVREALPSVLVPEMPTDATHYPTFLSRLRCFDNSLLAVEDRSRSRMYVAERSRIALKSEMGSLDRWLEMLELKITVETLDSKSLERAAQLFNKTNQMNLSTRRLPPTQLLAWAQAKEHTVWTFRVSDRFGDYGLCGMSSVVQNDDGGQLMDFLLSCRVMGRGVEDAMLATVSQHARDAGYSVLWADYIPSQRNQPCWTWLQSLAHADRHGNHVVFSLINPVTVPRHIQINRATLLR